MNKDIGYGTISPQQERPTKRLEELLQYQSKQLEVLVELHTQTNELIQALASAAGGRPLPGAENPM